MLSSLGLFSASNFLSRPGTFCSGKIQSRSVETIINKFCNLANHHTSLKYGFPTAHYAHHVSGVLSYVWSLPLELRRLLDIYTPSFLSRLIHLMTRRQSIPISQQSIHVLLLCIIPESTQTHHAMAIASKDLVSDLREA